MVLTVGFHMPRNNSLAAVDPSGAESPKHWERYVAEWVPWNHARAGGTRGIRMFRCRPDRPMTIRPFRASDRAALREVCMRTAHAGQDATGLFTDDALWPDVFLDPYLDFDPGLCFVVDAGGRAAGYVVATADTRAFVERYRREWMPGLEQLIAHLGFTPERMLHPDVDAYPAHLHIDLLPELQGRGRGRALIRRLLAELRARGVPGVHLGIDPANAAAAQFYRRLGFVELPSSTADEPRFGIATDAAV